MESFAKRVRKTRVDLGLTQGQLADLSGLKQPDISKIELGKIQQTTEILGLARALKVSPDWLATGEGPMHPVYANLSATLPGFGGIAMANLTAKQPQAPVDAAQGSTDLLAIVMGLTSYIQGMDPADREPAMAQIASLVNRPERAAKVVASIEAMAATGFAPNGKKAA